MTDISVFHYWFLYAVKPYANIDSFFKTVILIVANYGLINRHHALRTFLADTRTQYSTKCEKEPIKKSLHTFINSISLHEQCHNH